ncbi:P-II family nitrogen regulator [Rhodoplanes sp. SY1]|uniref:P-II family nitrogen regulator n=1 Tax=Rhodoplanes sp. SY1 TaxID=3166646 RepID=UPI0038B4D9E8
MHDRCLIVTIVRKGWGDAVLEASMAAGAHGGTIVLGRGIGRNEQLRVFGIQIEPEKEIVLTLVPTEIKAAVLDAIVAAAELDGPGKGLAFVVPVQDLVGVAHLVEE